jgi:hypothetical protein
MRTVNATIALVVVIGVMGGFYAGWKYSQTHLSATPAAATSAAGNGGAAAAAGATGGGTAAGGNAAAGAISGPITAVGSGTLTIHDRTTNKDVKVAYSPTVRIVKSAQGTTTDLAPNTTVSVIGQADASGTIQATAITIGNTGAAFGGAGGGRGRPSPSPST